MSLIFIDGFDHYSEIRDKWQVSSSFDQPTFVVGRFGGQSIKKQFQNAVQSIHRLFDKRAEVTFGMALLTPGFGGQTQSFFRILDTSGLVRCDVSVQSSGHLVLTAGGTSIVTTYKLDNIQWNYVEVHYIPKNTAGAGGVAEIRVNGNVVGFIDGATSATTTGESDNVGGFGFMDDGTNSPRYEYDDFYILDGTGTTNNSYLGDVRITTLAAGADGNRNEWSPRTVGADNYTEVDETMMDGNTYVESGLIGAAEDYNNDSFATRTIDPGNIQGVQVSNGTLRTSSGTIAFKHEMVIAGTRYSDDVEYTPGNTSFFITTFVTDTDPSDDATWTEAKVAATGSGIIITAKESI